MFEFDREIGGGRVRVRKLLPKTWSKAQCDTFDRQETARLYAVATGVERSEHSIEAAVLIYLKERAPKLKTGANVERELALLFPYYQGKPLTALAEVCKNYVKNATRERPNEKPLSPASLRNRIRYLTSACRYAWKEHGMGESDPAARVSVPTVNNERQVYADRETMLRLARACTNRGAGKVIRIAFYSGMRLSEILRAEVHGGIFRLVDTKNGSPRHIPIHPRIAVCARTLGTRVIKRTVQAAFTRACKVTGITGVHFHDLRHSSASEMINSGVDLYTVGAVLGHKDSRSTQRYAHLATDTLTAAVARIGRRAA
jgi:integrase